MNTMNTMNTINNIKVTVEYDTQEDFELAMALKKLQETQSNYKNANEYYIPKINAIGKAKWDIIRKQLEPLVEAMKTANIAVIRARYIDDKTGEEIHVAINKNNVIYVQSISLNENHRLNESLLPNSSFRNHGISSSGFITCWEEYRIYENLRYSLLCEIEKESNRIQKETNAIIDHFADVRDHN